MIHYLGPSARARWASLFAWGLLAATPAWVWAERPAPANLLPEETLALIRMPDTREMLEKLKSTGGGKIVQEEGMRALLAKLYASAQEAYAEIEDQVGVPLDDLIQLPQGEVFVAVTLPPAGSGDAASGDADANRLAVVVLLDVGERIGAARKLLERGEALMLERGAELKTEVIGDAKLNIFDMSGDRNRRLVQFEKDGAVCLTNRLDAARFVLSRWNDPDAKVKTLADNDKYVTIARRCQGGKNEAPQFTWFVDPIEIARKSLRGNAALALAVLPVLGVDGVQALGGSVILATDDFDAITHVHVSLDSPRAGVLEAVALSAGDVEPEAWVPAEAASYLTLHWDVPTTLRVSRSLYDSFYQDGALANLLKSRVSEPLGVDFETEILPALEGRFTLASWMEPPSRINSQSWIVGARLKEPEKFKETFSKLVDKFSADIEKQSFGGVTYYRVTRANPRFDELPEEQRSRLRRAEPTFCLFDDTLLVCDSTEFLHQAILAKSDPERGLAKQLDFKLIASKIKRQPGGDKPGLVTFNRPEAGLKVLYDVATADSTKSRLSAAAENNRFFKILNDALGENPLPAFSSISKHLAPEGGVLTSDETGLHYTAFSLKRK